MSKRDNRSAMSISTLSYFYIFCVKSHLIYVLTMLMRFTEAKATIPKLQMLFLLRVQLKRNTSSKLPFGLKKSFFSAGLCAEGYLRARTSLCMHVCVVRIIYHI